MLRPRDIRKENYHISARTASLARVLHCIVELVACPIGPCADADSRPDAGGAPAVWNLSSASSITIYEERDHVQRFSVQCFRSVVRGPKRNRHVDGGISGVVSRGSDAIC